jgi:hypothetical protein
MKTGDLNVDSYAGPSMRPVYFTGRSYHGPLHGHSNQGPSWGLSLSNRGRSEAIIFMHELDFNTLFSESCTAYVYILYT